MTLNTRTLVVCSLVLSALLLPAVARAESSPRSDALLTAGWKFIQQDVSGAEAPAFDDSRWDSVTLPHTWNAQDCASGRAYYRGPGWYRLHIAIDAAAADKSFFLKFDAANRNTDVYLNGQKVGSHKGGCAAFCFDVSSLLKPGDNVLAVKVDNAHDPDSPPLSADFTFFGGLYRPVHLLTLNKLSISPLDYASPGVYVKQAKVTPESADLEITVKLRSARDGETAAAVRTTIRDREGKQVQAATSPQAVPAHGQADAVQKITLANPHLWNGRQDPYLYSATVELLDGNTVVDAVTQPLGLRFFRVEADKGFFLNGKYYDLHGVCRHQDVGAAGWAGTDADQQRDYDLIAEMGCTTVRCAHYQHPGAFYDLCDKGGLVVWAEVPCVNDITLNEAFPANAKQQLTELIKQNYNHPSICIWSVGNEMTLRSKHPARKETWILFAQMHELAKQLDPTRLTALATCSKDDHPVNFMTDLLGYNKYFGWYGGFIPEFEKWIDAFHAKYPARPLGMTEYGAGANAFQHDPKPVKRDNKGNWHPEQYQMLFHEHYWKVMAQRPWVWGKYIWVMFDFAVADRHEGGQVGINDKGMVTRDRKIKKDVFYFYKASWSDEPTVHITARRFTPRPVADMPVKVYSNCDSVELKLNGQSLGTRSAADHIFLWTDATLKPGENTLEALGRRDGKTITDKIAIVLDPSVKIEIPADAKEEKPKSSGDSKKGSPKKDSPKK